MTRSKPSLRETSRIIAAWGMIVTLTATISPGQNRAKPEPTHGNVSYGSHERNVLDVWLAESNGPTPLVVCIHFSVLQGETREAVTHTGRAPS